MLATWAVPELANGAGASHDGVVAPEVVHPLTLLIAIGSYAVVPSNAAQEFGRAPMNRHAINRIDAPASGRSLPVGGLSERL